MIRLAYPTSRERQDLIDLVIGLVTLALILLGTATMAYAG
jgi:hypothetical protein